MGYCVPILVFLGLSVLDLGPMYATDERQHHCILIIQTTRHISRHQLVSVFLVFVTYVNYYAPAPGQGALRDDARLMSV